MRVTTSVHTNEGGWSHAAVADADWVLYFGSPEALTAERWEEIRARYPKAHITGCTTGGEIVGADVHDGSVVTAAVSFDKTRVSLAETNIGIATESFAAGARLGRELATPTLRCLFVLADGTRVNGSELVAGLRSVLGDGVIITGGLAGDGARFGATQVGADALPRVGIVAAVGLHGEALTIGHGSVGGWEVFGPERLVTKSAGSVLYELDGQPALDLYKKYLGKEADGLPGTALLFPLCLRRSDSREADLVRTVVGVDETTKSMTFAGDIPAGATVQLMRGSKQRLVEGAARAAEDAAHGGGDSLAILVSCIGRKLFLGQTVSDEVEAVCDVLGPKCATLGFYSYGELSPHSATGICELHNQTMTITTLSEAA